MYMRNLVGIICEYGKINIIWENVMRKSKNVLPIIMAAMLAVSPIRTYAAEEDQTIVSDIGVEEKAELPATQGDSENEENTDSLENLQDDGEGEKPTSNVSDVDGARNGVVQVNYVYVDDDEKVHIVKGGTGFLIGYKDKNEYVITCASNVSLRKDEKDAAYKYLGIKKNDNGEYENAKMEIQVVAESDVTVRAEVLTTSDELDLCVIRLSQPIHTRTPLAILTSKDGKAVDLPYAVADKVYALGLPDAVRYKDNEKYYSNDRVAMSTGDIVNLTTVNDIQRIQHDAEIGPNNCGGPLVNASGNVIGMNNLDKDGNYSCAIDSTVLIKVLDALGLEYIKLTEDDLVEPENVVPEPAAPVDPGQEETEKKTFNYILFIPIVLGIIVILGIIILVIKLSSKKKQDNSTTRSVPDIAKQDAQNRINAYQSGKIGQIPERQNNFGNMGTSALGAVPQNGTTVLGGGIVNRGSVISGSLIRKSNKKTDLIDKSPFIIGKDALHVNLCINDNGAISRMHAKIETRPDGVYIEDCNSTNGTHVNGRRVIEGQPVKLADGDIIKLADEEFEYHI